MTFFKPFFEGVPGGAPPWDHHQWIEGRTFYKTVILADKVYDFPTPSGPLTGAVFEDMLESESLVVNH